jgi:ferredoxin
MALQISNDDCIACDICVEQCPNAAISADARGYAIDPDRCTECVGHFDEAQCASICPAFCISH